MGTRDSYLLGHVGSEYSAYKLMPEVEVHMVTLRGKNTQSILPINRKGLSLMEKIRFMKYSERFSKLWRTLYCFTHFGCIPIVNKKHPEFSFYGTEFVPFSFKDILKKLPEDFVPDIIQILWAKGFITSQIVRDLHQSTGAKIIYSFVDEAAMTGGCHYPVECKGYLSGCHNCPALSSGKRIACKQLAIKENNLKDIPISIICTPFDYRLAKQTHLFHNAKWHAWVYNPKVTITPQQEARDLLQIDRSCFVVLIGSANINNNRKGFRYAMESLNRVSRRIDKLMIVCVGKSDNSIRQMFPNINVMCLGYVELEKLYLAFSAADCFLSTTIADSGPMMVNYSMAMGTPVVSFPVGIAEDLIVHKVTGYFAAYKNVTELADGIFYIYNLDATSRREMAKACIKRIQNLSCNQSRLDFLKELLR